MSITVTGRGSVAGIADEAVIELEVTVRRGLAAEALDGLAGAVAVVFAVLDDGPATARATTGLTLATDHDQQGRPRGHRASQVVSVVAPVDRAGTVVSAVVNAAGDDVAVRSLHQRASDQSGLRARARDAAVADAREAATQLAELAGRELGGLAELTEHPAGPGGQPRPLRAMAEAVPVVSGTDEVTVAITATWALA
ncbi:SIMPL domain-containing protein [Salsipaludibacter albus]|uniref:SIMPL domain-containing protein n=1 Tax=Salsipaludibacter albus TaxID=2849650 RepID=UPI001EE42A23|nr:SIMPL domain-containing protein [Salsipaludibacter albus]MBY5162677.1 SIMPL domain-containing protein [Salsipaludibacter albus]